MSKAPVTGEGDIIENIYILLEAGTNDRIRKTYDIEKQKILSGFNPNNCNVCNYHPACDIEMYRRV